MKLLVKAALAGALVVSASAAAVALVASDRSGGGPGTARSPQPAGSGATDGRLVLISGRDDHGLLATAQVRLDDRAGGGKPVAQVADGTLARVVSTWGTWLEVRTVEGPPAHGWVDDFYLRGVVHLVGPPPTCQVRLGGQWLPIGEQAVVLDVRSAQAQVRVLRTGQVDWVARPVVRELTPAGGCGPSASAQPDHDDSHH